jgi:hypothetical protein
MSFVQVVEKVVTEQVQSGQMFTAHDITLEVRNRGHKAGHNDVRVAVHDYFSRGGMGVAYTRTSITVPLGGNPFLYHRTVDDPANYANVRGQGMTPSPAVSTIEVPPPENIPEDNDEGDEDAEDEDEDSALTGYSPDGDDEFKNVVSGQSVAGVAVFPSKVKGTGTKNTVGAQVGRKVDARASLLIPAQVVRNAGFKAGDRVFVHNNDFGLVVLGTAPKTFLKRYTVNRNDHIRITQSAFKLAGMPGQLFDVSFGSGKVIVTQHK